MRIVESHEEVLGVNDFFQRVVNLEQQFVEVGGLMAYAANPDAVFRIVADDVHQILKGAKPGDIPIYQPTKFELLINLKTAKALGLLLPPAVLARAAEIIE